MAFITGMYWREESGEADTTKILGFILGTSRVMRFISQESLRER
jgi:hypothetical protein